MSLTDIKIRTAKPKEKPYKLTDERGLHLLVTPAGGKLWRLKYRIDGKEKLLSFGGYPDVSLFDAREKREQARKLIAAKADPSEILKAIRAAKLGRAANSFEVVARVWMNKYAPNLSKATADKNLRLFERDILPWIGEKPIAELRPKEILDTAKRRFLSAVAFDKLGAYLLIQTRVTISMLFVALSNLAALIALSILLGSASAAICFLACSRFSLASNNDTSG